MLDCGLCQKKFHTKHKLVQHFSEAHSIARQRARRTKISSMLNHMLGNDTNNTLKEYDHQNGDKIIWTTKQPIICDGCGIQFSVESSLLSHKCGFSNTREQTNMKQLVACEYCGRMYKDSRGVAIHQAFCVKRQKMEPTESYDPEITTIEPHMMNILTWYECPAEDCGAVFKDQNKLLCHLDKHHAGENLTLLPNSSHSPTPLQVANHVTIENYSSDPYKVTFNKPMVTVTMKPHIGKTEGLQDLSLLVTPTKGMEEIPEISNASNYVYNLSTNQLENDDNTGSITVEECKLSEEDHFPIKSEAILYLAEDGSVIHTSREKHRKIEKLQELEEERTFLLITEDDCNVELSESAHSGKERINPSKKSNIKFSVDSKQGILPKTSIIKMENEQFEFESDEYISESDMENWKTKYIDEDDEDWEVINVGKKKKINSKTNSRKSEHSCTLCGHTFLTELGYQSHLKNRDCRNKKFKLPRMFECHYLNCESSFFKLTELQRHWQVAHDYSMKSSMHEFDNEKDFSSWLVSEEEKYKVRYTCDVRRKKPTRDERLLICHRYHHLRTAAARKVNKRDYSDKHNWVHKITPCLCYARMKVYQDFDKDTCDYTGKIRVTYYYEHKHPEDDVSLNVEVIDHILLRNKRDREKRFQDMKGPEKVQHRQKLERLAREAGKDYRITLKSDDINPSIKNEKPTHAYNEDIEMETAMAVEHVTSNLLENDELFANQVEMVLDGQFDMNPEMLSGDVAEHNLDGLAIFGAQEEYTTVSTPEEVEELNSLQFMLPASTNDWSKLFELVQARISRDDVSDTDKAEAALVMPYEKVIELIPPSERIPIFRRLLDLANPNSDTDEEVQFEISMIS